MIICWRLILATVALIAAAISAQVSCQAAARYELKFQSELDNSTTIKRENQQQIFKCQIRLAPSNQNANSQPKLRSSATLLDGHESTPAASANDNGPNQAEQRRKNNKVQPQNVTLTIDWYRNGLKLANLEPIAVVNVELNKSTNLGRQDKRNKTRIEIKNTLNASQLKLTSRLKLSQLRVADSGQYKCFAKVQFTIPAASPAGGLRNTTTAAANEVATTPTPSQQHPTLTDDPNGEQISVTQSQQKQQQQQQQQRQQHQQLLLVEQLLESNGASLMVTNSSSPTPDEADSDGARAKSRRWEGDDKLADANADKKSASASGGSLAKSFGLNRLFVGINDGLHAKQAIGRQATTTTATTNNNNANNDLAAAGDIVSDSNGNQRHSIAWGPNKQVPDNNNNITNEQNEGHPASGSKFQPPATITSSGDQFEDDEDLYRISAGDQGEFISGYQEQTSPSMQSTNDDEDFAARRPLGGDGNKQIGAHRHPVSSSASDASDLSGLELQWPKSLDTNDISAGLNNESSSQLEAPLASNGKWSPLPMPLPMPPPPTGQEERDDADNSGGQGRQPMGGKWPLDSESSGRGLENHSKVATSRRPSVIDDYFYNPLDSTRLGFAKFVHKNAPELGCYTGYGEHYRGYASRTLDNRSCANWSQVRRTFRGVFKSLAGLVNDDDHHNHCRNPNLDPQGPWCYVEYMEELDGPESRFGLSATRSPPLGQPQPQQPLPGGSLRYIARSCSLGPCSEYLWLYIVAPPVGLLMLLFCLAIVLVRSIKRSHYKNFFAEGKRRSFPRFNKLILLSRGRYASAKKFASSAKKSTAGYLDDDIFEIVDEIDWSDGQTASMSPKSTESLRLNSSFSSSSASNSESAGLGSAGGLSCKSTNPLFSARALNLERTAGSNSTSGAMDLLRSSGPLNRSVTQVGPMFATLRCHVRGNSAACHNASQQVAGKHAARLGAAGQPKGVNKSTSTFIEQAAESKVDWARNLSFRGSAAAIAMESSKQQPASKPHNKQPIQNESHLISCSPSIESAIENHGGDIAVAAAIGKPQPPTQQQSAASNAVDDCGNIYSSSIGNGGSENFVYCKELPQLDARSISQALDRQLIYEGKFSQVQVAYIRATKQLGDDENGDVPSGVDSAAAKAHFGAQVAVCSLKPTAAIDQKVFAPSELKLRNLNHLNLVKLIGFARMEEAASAVEIRGSNNQLAANQPTTPTSGTGNNNNNNNISTNTNTCAGLYSSGVACSLIYDMTNLVDLSDWLKQQSKDTLTSNQPGDNQEVRRNLTCFAKQIALALDYLHDQGIVYKDLACRNCFLDASKMLVKLASFNAELVIESTDSRALSLKSMIRPKYLLDYYVIDSRPSECQLLPLSWIPLESILFNKFNKHTDVWSFGCLLYELFSLGEVAYFGYSSKQVIDAVRSNLMPPQPLLCPQGIYRLMCGCLSDIPTIRPNIKQIYEQLNLHSGQCSSFLDHHLCSLAIAADQPDREDRHQLIGTKCNGSAADSRAQESGASVNWSAKNSGSITKTKSYANIKNYSPINPGRGQQDLDFGYDNCNLLSVRSNGTNSRPEVGAKIPLSRSIHLGANRQMATLDRSRKIDLYKDDPNQYDEVIFEPRARG